MKLSNMASILRKYGLTVVETAGWANRGYAGQDLIEVRGVLWHHTATNRAAFNGNNAPTLSMCINGRSDLPGPLCHIVLGRDGTVYLTAAGLANHAGYGVAAGIPQDEGNRYLIGIEMESSGIAPWDWTADQLRVAPYLGAALELGYLMHLPPELRLQLGHMEYTGARVPNIGGKIDPAGWPSGMDGLRSSINATISELTTPAKPAAAPAPKPAAKPAPTPQKEAPVAISASDAQLIAKAVLAQSVPTEGLGKEHSKTTTLGTRAAWGHDEIEKLGSRVERAVLASEARTQAKLDAVLKYLGQHDAVLGRIVASTGSALPPVTDSKE